MLPVVPLPATRPPAEVPPAFSAAPPQLPRVPPGSHHPSTSRAVPTTQLPRGRGRRSVASTPALRGCRAAAASIPRGAPGAGIVIVIILVVVLVVFIFVLVVLILVRRECLQVDLVQAGFAVAIRWHIVATQWHCAI